MIAISVVAGGDSLPRLVPPQGAGALSLRGPFLAEDLSCDCLFLSAATSEGCCGRGLSLIRSDGCPSSVRRRKINLNF
jgi:hypothetical protein